MTKKEIEIGTQVISRVLESAAFIFTDEIDKPDMPVPETWKSRGVSIRYKGNPGGMLHMWAGDDFAKSTASNMLGMDEDTSSGEDAQVDALKELLNMIAGNFLTTMYGNEPVFDLGIPELLDRSILIQDSNHPDAFWIKAEESPLLFVIEVQ